VSGAVRGGCDRARAGGRMERKAMPGMGCKVAPGLAWGLDRLVRDPVVVAQGIRAAEAADQGAEAAAKGAEAAAAAAAGAGAGAITTARLGLRQADEDMAWGTRVAAEAEAAVATRTAAEAAVATRTVVEVRPVAEAEAEAVVQVKVNSVDITAAEGEAGVDSVGSMAVQAGVGCSEVPATLMAVMTVAAGCNEAAVDAASARHELSGAAAVAEAAAAKSRIP